MSAPLCGACGYDTTGLTSLTCPECGSDLRAAGIRTGPPSESTAGFVVQALALVVAWVLCGVVLLSTVTTLFPYRKYLIRSMRLSSPASGAYQAVIVVASVEGWEGGQPAARVQLQLVPLMSNPPAPLALARGAGREAVLAWLKSAGIDTSDPRVAREAELIASTAVRALRTRERFDRAVSFSSSSGMSMGGGPFSSTSTSVSGGVGRSNVPAVVFGVAWLALLAAGLNFLWRRTRRHLPAPVPPA